MNTESKFIKLCREIEELKLTFILFPHQAFSSKLKYPIYSASEAEGLLLESIKSITLNRISMQKNHQTCVAEDVLPDGLGSVSVLKEERMKE
jgi:hypothetical protein